MSASWSATHKITFVPQGSGTSQTWFVMLAIDTAADGLRAAVTHGEWLSQTTAAWTVDPAGTWRWRGRSTPRGEAGTVEVTELSGASKRLLGFE